MMAAAPLPPDRAHYWPVAGPLGLHRLTDLGACCCGGVPLFLQVIGNVTLGRQASIWYGAILRGGWQADTQGSRQAGPCKHTVGKKLCSWCCCVSGDVTRTVTQQDLCMQGGRYLYCRAPYLLLHLSHACGKISNRHHAIKETIICCVPSSYPAQSGDINSIRIGDKTNIQDNAIIHVAKHSVASSSQPKPTIIGSNVTVGHGATLHACTIGDGCLVSGLAARCSGFGC